MQTLVYASAPFIPEQVLSFAVDRLQCEFKPEVLDSKLKYTHIVPLQIIDRETYSVVEDVVQGTFAK